MNNFKAMYNMTFLGTPILGIIDILHGIDDFVIYSWTNENKKRKAKIYFNNNGEPFFKALNKRYYLKDFIKVV